MTITVNSPRRRMPRLATIAQYWQQHYPTVFPETQQHWERMEQGGWPAFCFRCGWLSPMPDDDDRPWQHANGWLERAHLHDRAFGGPDLAENMVPLCRLCHFTMPEFRHGAEPAIQWVRQGRSNSCSPLWRTYAAVTWGGDRYRTRLATKDLLALRFDLEQSDEIEQVA